VKLLITVELPDTGGDYAGVQRALRRLVTSMGWWSKAGLAPKPADNGPVIMPGTNLVIGRWHIEGEPALTCADPLAHATPQQYTDLINGRTTLSAIEVAYHGTPDVDDVSTD
jgi:hypothetical protein